MAVIQNGGKRQLKLEITLEKLKNGGNLKWLKAPIQT